MAEIRLAVPSEIDRYLDALVRTGPFGTKAELVRAAIVAYSQQAGPMAQDFDKQNHFSPDGRLYQVEYARESTRRGAPVAGAVFDKGVVLGASYMRGGSAGNPTFKPTGKIVRLSAQASITGTGLVADVRATIRHVRRQSWKSAEDLLDDLSGFLHERTLHYDSRPFGCALLVATTFERTPRLTYVDPSGALVDLDAHIAGMGAEEAREGILQEYRAGKPKDAEVIVARLLGSEKDREVVRLDV